MKDKSHIYAILVLAAIFILLGLMDSSEFEVAFAKLYLTFR